MVPLSSALALVLGLSAAMSSQDRATARLEPGEFRWYPERVSGGPVLAIVNITDQMLYVYQNGIEIGTSSVSTGVEVDHETLPVARDVVNRVKLHPRFATEVYEVLHPGTTLMVTDLAATEQTTTGKDFTILTTHDAVSGGGK